jgi:hypothetical protein
MTMEVHEIEVLIGKDGNVRIQVRDMKGDSCLLATKDLERLLGGEVLERRRTDGSDDFVVETELPSVARERIGEIDG